MRWAEIRVRATEGSADAVTSLMMDEGCGGTAVSRLADAPSREGPEVVGYLPVDDRLENRLDNIRERVRALPGLGLDLRADEITVRWVEESEWADAWKQFFKPIRISRIVIKPSWEHYEPHPDDLVVDIDPGMAFGTGGHPTTQLCILALQDYVKKGDTVLDMGTGSAILAMVAAKLGASRVVGLDIDTVAVEAARANIEHIGLTDTVHIGRAASPSAFEGKADVVVANIIAKVIVDMASGLAAKVKPGGKLIASGIVRDRAPDVIHALQSTGLNLIEERTDGEWMALILKHPERA